MLCAGAYAEDYLKALTIAVVGVLALATGCTSCPSSHMNEDVLKQDLYILRNAIDQFTQDKNYAPQSLEDLVRAGYLKEIPTDHLEGKKAWDIVREDTPYALHQTRPGITDVHSRSKKMSSEGTPYSSW